MYTSPMGSDIPRLIMNSPCSFVLLLLTFLFLSTAEARIRIKLQKPLKNSSISALFVFGDSTVDPGNNNYIRTIMKSNFFPYGMDFENHIPTGRFTNGRLATDFIASYVGVKETVPPYLDPNLSLEELLTGVSFASAGTGFDPLTAQLSGVIPVQQQLNYFREYRTRIEQAIGKEKAKVLIRKAAFLVSAGTNDFVVNYFGASALRRYSYTVPRYQQFLLENMRQLLQGLLQEGAQKVALVGLPPMGCLPIVITLNSDNAIHHRRCIEKFSSVARDYNQALQRTLGAMRHPSYKIVYTNIYDPLDDMIKNPQKYGFCDVNTGCCGFGYIEGAFLCNPTSILCADASKNVFWDAVHPTEATYYNLFKALRPIVDDLVKD